MPEFMTYRISPPRNPYALLRAGLIGLAVMLSVAITLSMLTSITSAVEVGKQEPLTIVTDAGKTEFKVEIADTDASREEGLMFRSSLPPDAGMLFDFKVTDQVAFWMKNTFVPLDMVFIRADGTVARIAADTTPLSEKTVPSEQPVRFVLEVNAGTAKRIGLKVGDKVMNRLIKGN
jgi:uncharacterized membrane protein (UPF0127 family)